jgi:hypothetical protein
MPKLGTDHEQLACPSSRPDAPKSAVFGIVDNRGLFPIIRYLENPVPVTAGVLGLAEDENPNQVFRFTSPCQGSACAHFSRGQCSLPALLEKHLPPAEGKHAACPIRNECRWFRQESFNACARCSAVVTSEYMLANGELFSPFETLTAAKTTTMPEAQPR